MNKQTILIVGVAVLVGVIGGYGASEFGGHRDEYGRGGKMGWGSKGGEYNNKNNSLRGEVSQESGGMSNFEGDKMGMDHVRMMVQSEPEFLEEMIPHHQEGIDTAKEVIARGGSTAEIKALAEGIVTAQEKEIADMNTWYLAWYGKTYENTGVYEPMMRDLSKLSGADLDKQFLEDMIGHHMGAIMMARSVQTYIEHPEVTGLTKSIVDTQSKEIDLMRHLLSDLR